MALSLAQYRAVPTREEILSWMLEQLDALGFSATSWQSGSIQRTILATLSRLVTNWAELARLLAEFGANDLASGAVLTTLSKSVFDNFRKQSVKAMGPFHLTSTASIPYAVEVGQLIVTNQQGVKFTNVQAGTVPAGGSVDLTFEALVAGRSGTIAPGSVLALTTVLAGVTVTNPFNPLTGTWYTLAGQDQESDASLRLRNRTKWALLSIQVVRDGVIAIALNASAAVRKVFVSDQNPRGAGTVDCYVAADFAVVGSIDLALVQAGLDAKFLGNDMVSPKRALALLPTPVVLNITGTVYFDPAFASTIQANVEQALINLIAATPLGGNTYSPGPSNVVARNDLIAAVEDAAGVRSFALSIPAGDVSVPTAGLVTPPPSYSITYIATS